MDKYILMIVFGFVLQSQVFSQSDALKKVDVTFPSPEATEIAKYGNLQVNMFKGVPSISVPVYTISLKDFSLPLSLNYDNSGVKVDQISTSVGLGWSLQAGGQITSMVHSLDDIMYGPVELPDSIDKFNPNYYSGTAGTSQYLDDYEKAKYLTDSDIPKNTKPDIYFYNYGSENGKFMMEGSWNLGIEAYPIPYKNIRIETLGVIDSTSSFGFKITDELGHKYIFSILELASTKKKQGSCGGGPSSQFPLQNPNSNMPIVAHTFHLSKIITVNQDTLQFEYDYLPNHTYDVSNVEQKYVLRTVNNGQGSCGTISDYSCTYEKTIYNKHVLKKIVHKRGGKSRLEVSFNRINSRNDFGGGNYKSLDEIVIDVNPEVSETYLKKIKLSQSYFQSFGSGSGEKYKRLRLDSVQVEGMPPYKFNYNTSNNLPHRFSYAQDKWGYYNGVGTNQTLVPNGILLTGAADRSVDTSKAKLWSLEKITYPTGGETVFDMEADPDGGGLRVKSIFDRNNNSEQINARYFNYTRHNYGNLNFRDDYSSYTQEDIINQAMEPSCEYDVYTSSSVSPLNVTYGADFGYSEVEVLYGDTTGSGGKTVYSYTTDLGAGGSIVWGKGELISETQYEKGTYGFNPVSKTENVYKVFHENSNLYSYENQPNEKFLWGLNIVQTTPEITNCDGGMCFIPAKFEHQFYKMVSAWYHVDTTYTYFGAPDFEVVKAKQVMEYDTLTTSLRKVTSINSNGDTRVTKYEYAHEKYPAMADSNMLVQPYSVELIDPTKDTADSLLSKNWTLWKDWGAGMWRPCQMLVWDGEGSPAIPTNCE